MATYLNRTRSMIRRTGAALLGTLAAGTTLLAPATVTAPIASAADCPDIEVVLHAAPPSRPAWAASGRRLPNPYVGRWADGRSAPMQ